MCCGLSLVYGTYPRKKKQTPKIKKKENVRTGRVYVYISSLTIYQKPKIKKKM